MVAEPNPPEQISEDEQTQLFYLLTKCQQAQQRLAMRQDDEMVIRVFELFRANIWQRYGLSDGDQIGPGGKIARAQVVRAPLPMPDAEVRRLPEHVPAELAQANGHNGTA